MSERSRDVAVLLLCGDEYRTESMARRWAELWCPADHRVFGLEEILSEGDSEEQLVHVLRRVLLGIETAPMFGGPKVVWWKAGSLLASPRWHSPQVEWWRDRLLNRIRHGLPPGHRLIITCTGIDRRISLIRVIKEHGEVVDLTWPEKAYERLRAVREWVEEELTRAGLRAEPEAVEVLIDRVPADGHALAMEIEKLSLYAGPERMITADDVREMVAPTRETEGWDLADRVALRDVAGAWTTCRRLLEQRAEALALIGGLESRFRELAILRDLLDRGWLRLDGREPRWNIPADQRSLLENLEGWNPMNLHPYRLLRLAEQSQRFTLAEISGALQIIAEARERMVSGVSVPELLLEVLVIQLARFGKRSS